MLQIIGKNIFCFMMVYRIPLALSLYLTFIGYDVDKKKECNVYIRRMHIIYRARLELYTRTRGNSAAVFRIKAK